MGVFHSWVSPRLSVKRCMSSLKLKLIMSCNKLPVVQSKADSNGSSKCTKCRRRSARAVGSTGLSKDAEPAMDAADPAISNADAADPAMSDAD